MIMSWNWREMVERVFGAGIFLLLYKEKYVTQDLVRRAQNSPDQCFVLPMVGPNVRWIQRYLPQLVIVTGPNHEMVDEVINLPGDPAARRLFLGAVEDIMDLKDAETLFPVGLTPFLQNGHHAQGRAMIMKYLSSKRWNEILRDEYDRLFREWSLSGEYREPNDQISYCYQSKVFAPHAMGLKEIPNKINGFMKELESAASNWYHPWYVLGHPIAILPSQRKFLALKRWYFEFARETIERNKQNILNTNNFIRDLLREFEKRYPHLTDEERLLHPRFVPVAPFMFGAIGNSQILFAVIPPLLHAYPQVRIRLEHELKTSKDLRDSEYFDRFMKELYRFVTPTGSILRTVSERRKIGHLDVPKNSMIVMSFEGIHRNPKLWKGPHVFDPDREELKYRPLNRFPLIPFGTGERICPTQAGFKTSMKEFLQVYLEYDFVPCDGYPKEKFTIRWTGLTPVYPLGYNGRLVKRTRSDKDCTFVSFQ